jgi:hypothetical protein
MYRNLDPDQKRHALYFPGGFVAVSAGFAVLLAGFFAGSEVILYTGAGFMCCAAIMQNLLLFPRYRTA